VKNLVSKDSFARALENYVTANLRNNVGFEAFEGFDTEEGATVNLQVNRKGILIVTKAETFEGEASSLKGKLRDAENELKQAKKTISNQETTIENLNTQLEEKKTATQETEEVIATPTKIRKAKNRQE
jgi:chromosome segregation ATPase